MAEREGVVELAPQEAVALLAEGAVLLDVREADEWRVGHVPGALHIPLGELAARLEELPDDVLLVAVCRSGGRSALAAAALSGAGWPCHNLSGGMCSWQAAGLAVLDASEQPGRVL
ncbi:MAG: rhodanese-like domain-containing protein [Actinomycetota bacterium]|nr:rhodanese-like domain-containing protein [Actinomycetota bacterium]